MLDPRIVELLDTRRQSPFGLAEHGERIFWPFLRPCRVKILMLVDASISFNHAYFGLSAVLDTLRVNPEFFVKFDVTRAHRGNDLYKPDPAADPVAWARYGPHFEDFSFIQPGFDLDAYDEVWLFGFYGEGHPGALEAGELEVLSRWMDAGGGLLAMGDHEDLGAALCSEIPRVRSMRKWTAAQGVPPAGTPARHDTLLTGADSSYTFDDESDDQPMPIEPKFYNLWGWSPFVQRRAPHPILCGQDGVIDILPDHPHEGEIRSDVEVDLTQSFTFGSYTNAEYPTVGGVQTKPEVIAWARVRADHPSTGLKGVANPKRFGVIGAYDGHPADVGRVTCDSTWHHWFDVNLTGRPIVALDSAPMDATNPKVLGFTNTSGLSSLARIQNYFRNVAMWLAPESLQRCMFLVATWGIVLRYPLNERLSIKLPLWELGGVAHDTIGRRANQCTLRHWIFDLFPLKLLDVFRERRFPPGPTPCLTCPPFELVETYVLGGITRRLLAFAYDLEREGFGKDEDLGDERVLEQFLEGAREGVDELLEAYDRSLDRSREMQDRLSELLPSLADRDAFHEGWQTER